MIYVVTLSLVLALVATVTLGGGLLRTERREHLRRESLLIDQLLHATGKTWTPPPVEERVTAPDVPWEPRPVRFTATPEQFPA